MAYLRNIGFKLLEGLESEGRRTFTVEEAMKRLGSGRGNTLAILGGLRRSKRIVSLTSGFYALWHPSERRWGIHPLPVIDAMMKYRKCPYYVGLLSAADYYGTAHHKPQVLQVIINKQLKFRKAKKLAISFHVFNQFPSEGLSPAKAQGEMIIFSSPERTALDLFCFEAACGGFKNVCLVIRDLIPKLKVDNLKKVIDSYPYLSSIQKLGYMLEYFKADKQLNLLSKWADNSKLPNTALSARLPKKGKRHPFWHIVENAKIEEEE